MKNILVIGATGQVGSELALGLRKRYSDDHVIAGYIPSDIPQGELKASGPSTIADVTDRQSTEVVARQFKANTTYSLAALLSVVAKSCLATAWKTDIDELWNVLGVAREYGYAVFIPSSIGSFGESTPHVKTPQGTIQHPRTMYNVTKVTTELLSDYHYTRCGVDTCVICFPGIISNVTPPGGDTADYAVDIFYSAVKGEKFTCLVRVGTFMDMMYMSDAINAVTSLMRTAPARLRHRNAFNIASMSFDPRVIYAATKKRMSDFEMTYQIDPLKQVIVNSQPDSLDDSCAREEWDWMPQFDLGSMTADVFEKLRVRLNK